ncbi:MAG TPA: helix-turn-helix domain-containing protein [Lacunisphaera sp.]|jgi:cytoskeleton protein RodZ|nr:helix-turn-helix domain-containing protein [Lacunisphaera sp.]HQY05134.1 helix-turn-helix domain-containing protein [Lacunisphaera sp.]
MQTIGERLEEARKRKGISIREAAESTKIRGDYLQKFEANIFEAGLPPLYVRGFLRSYARFLDLDPDRVVSDFDSQAGREGKSARRESREVYGRVDFNETARATETGEPAAVGGRSAQDQAVMLKFALLGGGALVAVIVIVLLFKVLFGGSPAKPTPTAQGSTATVQAEAAQTLTLTAIDATRVKVVQDLDGAILFNGSLARAETKSFKKQGKLLITVEAGKNLRMEVNGRNYPVPLDGYGRFALD